MINLTDYCFKFRIRYLKTEHNFALKFKFLCLSISNAFTLAAFIQFVT